MSKFVSGLLGGAALMVAVGAAQFAVGQNLPSSPLLANSVAAATVVQSASVNRAAKADQPVAQARENRVSFSTHVSASADSSIAVRVPRESQLSKVGPGKPAKRPVACEASASVLAEVAKLMESARCVT